MLALGGGIGAKMAVMERKEEEGCRFCQQRQRDMLESPRSVMIVAGTECTYTLRPDLERQAPAQATRPTLGPVRGTTAMTSPVRGDMSTGQPLEQSNGSRGLS